MAEREEKTPPPQSLRSLFLHPPPSFHSHHSPPPLTYKPALATPFRPSIAVIVAVLTTMFSITFLLLLYAKHCKRGNGYHGSTNANALTTSTAQRNSGIDRSVIETLPIFRFSSLRGQKDGLECSVCLNRFESNEVLRLLPKCKHAFHVECVDTWLDAHSTCPLCRYRVDPEDVLLVEEIKLGVEERTSATELAKNRESAEFTRRISGRHSSAGERTSNFHFLQILIEKPSESTQYSRRSVDSAISRKRSESVTVGCFERGVRKDGLLLSESDRENFLKRFEHKIILSNESGSHNRWSDLRPSDLLYLQSEMIISNNGRYSLSSNQHKRVAEDKSGRDVINARSVSEITGLNRFSHKTEVYTENSEQRI
ncbi:hypothetical protein IFM89_001759 [Coptis chinensis]|uniref:RING-type E3 ubiquitin transferase n=1 Tax=Coptis chinensis TaxID=261450 RepID=A0A835LLA9_9MAGN|nr:hypothetical protein IFM89_001759 [Coptis chinensis]